MSNMLSLKQIKLSSDLVKELSMVLGITILLMLFFHYIERFAPDGKEGVKKSSEISKKTVVKRNGIVNEYYPNGSIEWQSSYKNGKKNGVQKWYNTHGS